MAGISLFIEFEKEKNTSSNKRAKNSNRSYFGNRSSNFPRIRCNQKFENIFFRIPILLIKIMKIVYIEYSSEFHWKRKHFLLVKLFLRGWRAVYCNFIYYFNLQPFETYRFLRFSIRPNRFRSHSNVGEWEVFWTTLWFDRTEATKLLFFWDLMNCCCTTSQNTALELISLYKFKLGGKIYLSRPKTTT